MTDNRPGAYHDSFWKKMNEEHPDVAERFVESGYDWNKLSDSDRRTCQDADRFANEEAKREQGLY